MHKLALMDTWMRLSFMSYCSHLKSVWCLEGAEWLEIICLKFNTNKAVLEIQEVKKRNACVKNFKKKENTSRKRNNQVKFRYWKFYLSPAMKYFYFVTSNHRCALLEFTTVRYEYIFLLARAFVLMLWQTFNLVKLNSPWHTMPTPFGSIVKKIYFDLSVW